MDALKSQHKNLTGLINSLARLDTSFSPPLPSTIEEDKDPQTPSRFTIPLRRISQRTSTANESLNEWFDAQEDVDGAEEFVLDFQASPRDEMPESQILTSDSHSSLGHLVDSGADTDSVEEKKKLTRVPPQEAQPDTPSQDVQLMRRSQLPTGPVGDEGSLFAILKKNIGKVCRSSRYFS
jgi:hypothetical protein